VGLKRCKKNAKAVKTARRRRKSLVVEEQRLSDISRRTFLPVGRLDKQRHSEKKTNIRRKKERQKMEHKRTGSPDLAWYSPLPPLASFNDRIVSLHSSIPSAYRLRAASIPASEPGADMITKRRQGGSIRGERGQGGIRGPEELGELF
jgi:hypothetical protein